jgi:hypothetical protein
MLRLQREGNTMNLKAWLYSLAAAAISAFATSVTAAIVDPSNFNFTLAGFERLAAVGGLSAVVAVLALLKQSPLPDGTQVSATTATKVGSVLLAATLLPFALTACTNWEQTTYQALASSKAVLDQAQIDYETGTAISHNAIAYQTITAAKAAQTTAVNAMVTYEQLKAVNTTSADALTKAQGDVETALAALPTLLSNVKALYAATGGK